MRLVLRENCARDSRSDGVRREAVTAVPMGLWAVTVCRPDGRKTPARSLPRIRSEKLRHFCLTKSLLLLFNVLRMATKEHVFEIGAERGIFMKTVNMGSNYTHRVTLRLNDEQYDFLIRVSNILGVSPSDYMRMCVNAGMVSSDKSLNETMKGMVGTNENVKTDCNDKL